MRRFTERILAFCLLALMVLSLAPQDALHHCDADHGAVEGPFVHAACSVSDHALPVLVSAPPPALPALERHFHRTADLLPAAVVRTERHAVTDRGPPTIG